jgi:hemolysin D
MVIVPQTVHLEIEANLANKDAGFVHVGQEVAVKVEAFTFMRYGLLHSTVASVSRDVVAPDANGTDVRSARDDVPGRRTAIKTGGRGNRCTSPTSPWRKPGSRRNMDGGRWSPAWR